MSGPELVVLDVGQGDAIVLHDTASGQAVLVDCPAGRSAVPLAFLHSRRLSRLRALLVSHLHDDHYGGVLEVLREIPADEILVSLAIPAARAHPKAAAFLREIRRITDVDNCSWAIPQSTMPRLEYGAVQLNVLAPDDRAVLTSVSGTNANQASTIVSARLGSFSALLAADAPSARWQALLDSDLLRPTDVFVCPHHGAAFDAGPAGLRAVLERVLPRVIIVSVGATNRYGHPDLDTLEALGAYAADHGARLVCTQLNRHCAQGALPRGLCAGTIVVTAVDGGLDVGTERPTHKEWVASQVADPRCHLRSAA
jgi:competence protein ComEC